MNSASKELKNPVLVIAGPTASGKSALGARIAHQLNGVVLNCDSMQIYKGIPVITASPDEKELQLAEHRLFGLYDCAKRGNVVEWLDLCVAEIHKLWNENRLPVVVGGTGLYIDALINGVTPIPEVSANIREQFSKQELPQLYAQLQEKDADIAEKISPNDRTRIVRALEILTQTGVKVSDWYKVPLIQKIPEANFMVVKIVPSIDEIARRCCLRLDEMVYKQGGLAEIEGLLNRGLPDNLPAMKALGVPELSQFIRGEISLDEAMSLAKLHTRQYAKRQRTWLRNKLPANLIFETPFVGQPEYLSQIISSFNL